ncbi:MAG: glycosyltransferase family 2 protein [Candidatus Dormiibacterota bacterium]
MIIVTYNTPLDMLGNCLQSVNESTYRPLQLVVIDNSISPRIAEFISAWKTGRALTDPELIFVAESRNVGYAAATNIGIAASSGALLLLLNPDTVLQPEAVPRLVGAAARHPDTIGFAPKIRLASHQFVIDSVGIDLHLRGQAAQRGVGEPDIGQYDAEERVSGLCFAGALVRRSAFTPEVVGPLDSRYFMFYEDVDWSMRAAIYGYKFRSVPSAEIVHVHSASTRHMHRNFKIRLVQRNWMWTAIKNLERRRVGRVFVGLMVKALLRGLRNGHLWASVRATAGAWTGLPRVMRSRRVVQRRRTRPDVEVLSEPAKHASFNVDTYQPIPSAMTLVNVLSRLYATAPEPLLGKLVLRLNLASETSMILDAPRMASMVRDSGVPVGPGLEWLLSHLELTASK